MLSSAITLFLMGVLGARPLPAQMGGPPRRDAPAPPPTETVQAIAGAVDGQVFIVTRDGVHPLSAGDRVRSASTVRTSLLARLRLELPDGARVYLGPASVLNIVPRVLEPLVASPAARPPHAPLDLAAGEAIVENRPGRPGAPTLTISAPLVTVEVEGDSRAAVRVTAPNDVTHATVRLLAMRGRMDLHPAGGLHAPRSLVAPEQAIGASARGGVRWSTAPVGSAEIDATWRRVFPDETRQLLEGRPTIIDWESLAVCGIEAVGQAGVLTQAQLDDGELVFHGRIRPQYLPGPQGQYHVEVTWDGWASAARVDDPDAHGSWFHSLTPQDGMAYEVGARIVETDSGRVIERTPSIPIRYVEQPHVTIESVTVGDVPFPEQAPLHLELDDLVASKIVLTAHLTGVAPAGALAAVASGDGGLHWREATITPLPQGDAWDVAVSLEPVPGATYRAVIRLMDRTGSTEGKPVLTWQGAQYLVYHEETTAQRVAGLLVDLVAKATRGDIDHARAVFAPQFEWTSRDLMQLREIHLVPGTARREGGLCKVAATWTRPASDGGQTSGEAVFAFARNGDWQILDIYGDDPLAPSPMLLRPPENGSPLASTSSAAGGPLRKVSLVAGQTYDFLDEHPGPYDAAHIPRDVGFVIEEGSPFLVTHDRRLVDLGPVAALAIRSLDRPDVEWSARTRPEPGHTYYLRTRGHRGVLLQVDALDVGGGGERGRRCPEWNSRMRRSRPTQASPSDAEQGGMSAKC